MWEKSPVAQPCHDLQPGKTLPDSELEIHFVDLQCFSRLIYIYVFLFIYCNIIFAATVSVLMQGVLLFF